MTGLTIASIVERSNGIVEAEVDGEVVALNIAKGACYGLNKVGSRIWALIADPKRIDEVCATLIFEYDVDSAVCQQQVLQLFEDLRAEGMIAVHEDSGVHAS